MRTDLFQSCGHCWVFQICWHIECSTFTASSFRVWNSSTGIPTPRLALFLMMLPKSYLTSHSRMSGSRWVTPPSWLSGSLRPFLYSSSVYSYHFFLISSASVRSIPSVLYWAHLCMKWSLGISGFLEELSSLSHSVVFLYFFVLITEEGFLISPCYFLEPAFKWVYLSFSPLPLASLLFSAICTAYLDSHFAFCISFSWGWSWSLPPVQCHKSPSIVLQALYLV